MSILVASTVILTLVINGLAASVVREYEKSGAMGLFIQPTVR